MFIETKPFFKKAKNGYKKNFIDKKTENLEETYPQR